MPSGHPAAPIPAESPAAVTTTAATRHPVAAELLSRVRAEFPRIADLGQREPLLAAAWLMSLRSARTRRAYCGDLRRG